MSRRPVLALLLLLSVVTLAAVVLETQDDAGGHGELRDVRQRAVRPGLNVSGNHLVDRRGRVVRFRGVNRSGTEYACIQGWGIFDGPSDAGSVRAMTTWRINAVRIPLNEDCWLGINGVKRRFAGARYRGAIVGYVRLLHRHGIDALLSLTWGAPGAYRATYQSAAPDSDHSPSFWSSLASTFKHDRNVVLSPWGEPLVNAGCFLRGGVCEATYGPENTPYRTAGMQQAVDVMRRVGYRGVIAIPGINHANDLTQWLTHMPRDPRRSLVAEAHVYGDNACASPACLNAVMTPITRRVPLVLAEVGESFGTGGCQPRTIPAVLAWADAHRAGYYAWTWNATGNCSGLIRGYGGTPFSTYASWLRDRYRQSPAPLSP